MKESISITVPMEYTALNRAAEFFKGLSQDVLHTLPEKGPQLSDPETENIVPPSVMDVINTVSSSTGVPVEELTADISEPEAAEVFAEPESGDGLDVNGIPWDERIHASTKTKTVDGAWKNKRGVDKGLLASVESELKGATTADIAPNAIPAGPIVGTVPPTPPAAPAASSITTFPALMTAITSRELGPDAVLSAVQSVGLQSLPLLAAQTDLIPQVAERLGL